VPQFSAFTPYGMLEFSSRPSHGEVIYKDMLRNAGVDENVDPSGNLASELYADAMLSARVLYTLERAGNQADPRTAQEKLAQLEFEHGVTPPPNATLGERRRELARIRRLNNDGRFGTISQALVELLGDNLVKYRTVRIDELPPTAGDTPPGALLVESNTPVRIIRTLTQVSVTGTATPVKTQYVTGSLTQLVTGQKVLISPSDNSRAEVVEVASVTSDGFTAVFSKPHDAGVLVTTGQHPIVQSYKRIHQIIVTDPNHIDTDTRLRVAETMRRAVKGTAIWQLMGESTAAQAGPFRTDEGLTNTTPIGIVS
jgi:hypothetical protein